MTTSGFSQLFGLTQLTPTKNKKYMKKSLLLFFALLSMMQAWAYDAYINGIYYRLSGTTATVTYSTSYKSADNSASYTGSVTIPSSITYSGVNYSVTSIGRGAFYNCSSLTSVTIPSSVTSIGDYAFYECSSLTSATIPSSVTSIGEYAFAGCSGLTSVTIPKGVTGFGKYAFRDCYGLTSVTIPKGVTEVSVGVFQNCRGLTSVTIPKGVTSIYNWAFGGCNRLTSVTIPASVTWIGHYAFYYCKNLTSVISERKHPNEFGSNSFTGISTNCVLTVPYGTKDAYIAAGWTRSVFMGGIVEKPAATIITFADANVKALCVTNWDTDGDGELSDAEAADVTDLGAVFLYQTNITSFDELQYFTGLTSIGESAFCYCSNLTSVTIPESVTTIGEGAFMGCSSLTAVTIPESVTSIEHAIFGGCSSLTSMTIPKGVTSIGEWAFSYCSSLTSVTIPKGVTTIGEGAFYGCSGLTSVSIPSSVTSISSQAFSYCSGLASISVDTDNPSYDSRNDCNAIIETASNSLILGCKNTVIPTGVTSIGNYAFEGCNGLTSITIPESVTSIGESAFCDCSGLTSIISEITVPFPFDSDAFTSIASSCVLTIPYGTKDAYIAAGWTENTFKGGIVEQPAPAGIITFADANVKALCVANWDTDGDGELSDTEAAAVTDLGAVFQVKESIASFDELQCFTGLTSIDNFAFAYCGNLSSITIPSSVISIGRGAFSGCFNLTSVTIPSSVTSIGKHAFYGCI